MLFSKKVKIVIHKSFVNIANRFKLDLGAEISEHRSSSMGMHPLGVMA